MKVDVRGPDDCWLWTAGTDNYGYGVFSSRNRQLRAHRFAWIVSNASDLSSDQTIDHLCYEPLCQNPSHMEVTTAGENRRRARRWLYGASQRNKAHCPSGHEYSEENTRWYRKKSAWCRQCKECNRKASREHKRRAAGKSAGRSHPSTTSP